LAGTFIVALKWGTLISRQAVSDSVAPSLSQSIGEAAGHVLAAE